MKTKVYLVIYTSYTESDNYLYNDVRTFTDEEEARHEFISLRDGAYDECQWGAAWDSIENMSEEEREGEYKYDVEVNDGGDTYQVSSDAYEGYKVEVKLICREIETPATICDCEQGKLPLPTITFKGFDLRVLNRDFQNHLKEHENDTDVTGASRQQFNEAKADNADWEKQDPQDFADSVNFYAMAYNAWDALCEENCGLRDSGLDWFCGASRVGFENTWDLYVGTGNEA